MVDAYLGDFFPDFTLLIMGACKITMSKVVLCALLTMILIKLLRQPQGADMRLFYLHLQSPQSLRCTFEKFFWACRCLRRCDLVVGRLRQYNLVFHPTLRLCPAKRPIEESCLDQALYEKSRCYTTPVSGLFPSKNIPVIRVASCNSIILY